VCERDRERERDTGATRKSRSGPNTHLQSHTRSKTDRQTHTHTEGERGDAPRAEGEQHEGERDEMMGDHDRKVLHFRLVKQNNHLVHIETEIKVVVVLDQRPVCAHRRRRVCVCVCVCVRVCVCVCGQEPCT
jgi:hypothetical protein